MPTPHCLGPDLISRDARALSAALLNADINTSVPAAAHMRTVAMAIVMLAGALFTASALAQPTTVRPEQTYPTKPIRAVFPISPGSSLDIVGRLVFQKLSESWARQVVVDNRPGAGGTLGTALVARAPADGYTLLPETPTLIEAGVAGYEESLWFGIWAPHGVPAGIVDKIAQDVARTVALPALREPFRKLAAEPLYMTPAEFARFVRRETETVARIAKYAGIKAQ